MEYESTEFARIKIIKNTPNKNSAFLRSRQFYLDSISNKKLKNPVANSGESIDKNHEDYYDILAMCRFITFADTYLYDALTSDNKSEVYTWNYMLKPNGNPDYISKDSDEYSQNLYSAFIAYKSSMKEIMTIDEKKKDIFLPKSYSNQIMNLVQKQIDERERKQNESLRLKNLQDEIAKNY